MQKLTRRNLLLGAAVTLVPAFGGAATTATAELKFIVSKDSAGKFRWRLVSPNGQTVATPGQGYASKQACLKGIDVVRQGAANATLDDRTKATP